MTGLDMASQDMRARAIEGAAVHIRARMGTSNILPRNKDDLTVLLRDGLMDSCHELTRSAEEATAIFGPTIKVTGQELVTLLDMAHNVNFELQELARRLVIKHFGFIDTSNLTSPASSIIAMNEKKALRLKVANGLFDRLRADGRASDLPSHKYCHPILEEFILQAWFSQGANSAGCRASSLFDENGIPIGTIAFAMTAIFAALREWQTGKLHKKNFLFGLPPPSDIIANFHNCRSTLTLWERHTEMQSKSLLTYTILRIVMLHHLRNEI